MQTDEAIAHLLRGHILVRWDTFGARGFSEAQKTMEEAQVSWNERGEPTFRVFVALKFAPNGDCLGPYITTNGTEAPWHPTVSDWFSRAWVLVDREHCVTAPPQRRWWQFWRR